MSTHEVHGGRRVWRWSKRILLGLATLVVVVVAAALITLHTDYGRELLRKQVQAQLDNTFVGGATIGKIEGSPFSNLVLRDLVINGPDRKPAITIGRLELKLGLLPLISHQARLAGLIAEDVDIQLKRDQNGGFQIAHLTKPGPKSNWSVDLPKIELKRGHLWVDMEKEPIDLDGLEIIGAAHMPAAGPLQANILINGAWRQRAAGFGITAVVRIEKEGFTFVPSVTARVGGVTIAGAGLRIAPSAIAGKAPRIDGTLIVSAPAAAVRQLVPGVDLPADLAVAVTATSAQPWTNLSVVGMVGNTPVRAMLSAELDTRRARGVIGTGTLDLTALTRGKVVGHGGALVTFDAMPNAPGELPAANAMIHLWGDLADAPDAKVTIALNSSGYDASALVDLDGNGATATLAANIHKAGEVLTLDRGTLTAMTRDPARASGGKAPVHGQLAVNLSATGALQPHPNLAIVGKVDGKNLRMKDLSVASLALRINAKQLPSQPLGSATLELQQIVRQDKQLGELKVDASNRADGKIAVAVRSNPKHNPWMIDLDALITPPGAGQVTIIDVLHHHVRAGAGQNWTGSSGHLEIGPQRIELRDLKSSSSAGNLAVDAMLDRAGRNAGDLVAKVDATHISLDNLSVAYRGSVDAHVDVSRKAGRWAGDVDVKAAGVSIDPATITLDAHAKVHAAADQLQVDLGLTSLGLGTASFALDVDAPDDIANVRAWKTLGRSAIRTGHLKIEKLDLGKLAHLAGKEQVTGRVDGDIQISSHTTGGMIQIRDVMAPALRGTGGVSADLQISQSAPNELMPSLVAKVDGVGGIRANARLDMPDRLFDPAAWKALGKGALKSASMRVDNINIDPGLLDRFNIVTELRGRASMAAEVGQGARDVQLAFDLNQLRGNPIARPVDVHVAAAIDNRATNVSVVVRERSATLFDLRGQVPVSMDRLIADPQAVRDLPIAMTATIPSASAPALLGVFGRSEITGGTIKGTIKVEGTVGHPTAQANIVGLALQVPPGYNNKPVKTVEKITIDGSWDGTTGKLAIAGVQQNGSLDIVAQGRPSALQDATVTVKAKDFDLIPLLAFAPGPAGGAAGRLDANLSMTGLDPATAKVAGELHLRDARVPIAPAVGTMWRSKIDVVIAEHDLKVSVDGRLGQGTIKVRGTVAMDGASPTGGDAAITLRGVSPIGSVEPVIDADITSKLHREGTKWIADVVIDTANVNVPSDRGEKLKPAGAPTDMVFANGERITKNPMKRAPPTNAGLAVNIRLKTVHVKSKEINTLLKGNLAVTADAQSVGIVGDISMDRGDLDLFGRRYQVDHAAVHFDGTPDPLLDVRITHDFPTVTTITQVRGRLSKPELMMSSEPGTYSQGQLLGFLLGGEPDGDPTGASARDKVTSAGASFVANKIGGYVKDALPVDIDVLKYEAASSTSSAAITVGTWISESLFLAYKQHLAARPDENTGEGQAEYYLTRRVVVEGTIGNRGYDGVDLLWRKRY